MSSIRYDEDVVAWANQQAGFMRAGRFVQETGLDSLPRQCPWPTDDVLTDGWLPG